MPTDLKISELTESTLGASDYIPIARSSSNYKLNLQNSLASYSSDRSIWYVDDGVEGDTPAVGDGVTNDKTAIQNVINAAYTAGGGDVFLTGGKTYIVDPAATGIGLLLKTGVRLIGGSPDTTIRFISSTSAAVFEGIAPFEYDTTAVAFGAHELWVESLRLECDAYLWSDLDNTNAHGLLGIIHCPKAIIRNVAFGQVAHHAIEINKSKNVLIEHCDFLGGTESSRIQIDNGLAGARSVAGFAGTNNLIENVIIQNCRIAGRNATGLTNDNPRLVEITHSTSNLELRNITFDQCEFGAVYKTNAAYAGFTLTFDGPPKSIENLNITNCKFYGMGHGLVNGIFLAPGVGVIRGLNIENNYFGYGIDVEGTVHSGGFATCIVFGNNLGSTAIVSSTSSSNYATRQGVCIRNNVLAPRWVTGLTSSTWTAVAGYINVGGVSDAIVEGNQIYLPPFGSTFTAATSDLITTLVTHELKPGDPVRFTTTGTLPAGLSLSTTYFVIETPLANTLKVSATLGGSSVDITDTGSGTHTWVQYLSGVTMSFVTGFVLYEIVNSRIAHNILLWQHDTQFSSSLAYSMSLRWSGLEASSVSGFVEIINNRILERGAGSATVGLVEWAAALVSGDPFIKGRVAGNITEGTFSSPYILQGHPGWRNEGTILNAGKSTDTIRVGGVLTVNITPVGNVTTGEDNLMTFSVPASTLGTDLDYIEFEAAGTIANNANAKRIKVYFGATAIFDTGAAGIPTSVAVDFVIRGKIIRTGAATQKCMVLMSTNSTLQSFADYATAAETLSGAVTLKLTGEGTATNDISQELFTVSWFPANT